MTTYIVEGRCDCQRLARCQLLGDRLMALIPSIVVNVQVYGPDDFQARLKIIARNFPNISRPASFRFGSVSSILACWQTTQGDVLTLMWTETICSLPQKLRFTLIVCMMHF